jgi:hypothetical protein
MRPDRPVRRALRFCRRSAQPVRTEPYGPGSTRTTKSASTLLSRADAAQADHPGRTRMSLIRLKTARSAVRSRPCPTAPPQVDCAKPRSALGPCRNGRARASAVTNGRQRFSGTASHGPSSSSSRDDAARRFGLWSRRSGVRVPSVTLLLTSGFALHLFPHAPGPGAGCQRLVNGGGSMVVLDRVMGTLGA